MSKVTDISYMFKDVTLTIENCDNLFTGWAKLSLQKGVNFDAGNSQYTNIVARKYINNAHSWIFIDGGLDKATNTSESNFLQFSVLLISIENYSEIEKK